MKPTPYSDLNQILQEFVTGVRAILDGNLIGIYLQGSFAVGDFDTTSDADWIVACARELSDAEVAALRVLHDRIPTLDNPWAQHLEGSYFPLDELRDYTRRGRDLWYVDHGSREIIRSNHCNMVLVRWVVREYGVTLTGPAPVSLVDPIPVEALRQEILDTLTGWGAEILADPAQYQNRFYQVFIVLNYCRMLHDLQRGCPGSKLAGAEWGKVHLDPVWTDLIDRAWHRRPGSMIWQEADPDDYKLTLDFVRYGIEEGKRIAAELGLG